MPTLKSVTVGVWVNTGSRDEQSSQAGYSHFIEHMLFKGTRNRSSSEISREIDALGGEMNAFTSRETTTYYVKVLDQQLDRALELLSDLFHHSRFAPKDIEKDLKLNVDLDRVKAELRKEEQSLATKLRLGEIADVKDPSRLHRTDYITLAAPFTR